LLAKFKHIAARPWGETAFALLLVLAVVLFAAQMLSLYSTPVPDSYLWWGDESWLTVEFRTQILEGVFRHPYALSSSLEDGSGLIFGNMWIPAVLYGVPAAILKNHAVDIILIGRSVTAVLALTLLVAVYEIIERRTSEKLFAIFGVILLLSSRSFLFTSHSARYDILTALAIVIGIYLALKILDRRSITPRWSAILGFITAASLLITIHVTLAIGIAIFAALLIASPGHRIRNGFIFVIGAVLFVLILVGVTALRGRIAIFVSSSAPNAYYLNLRDIPAFRPFSRSVQIANIVQKWGTLSTFAWGYIPILIIVIALAMFRVIRKQTRLRVSSTGAIILCAILSWLIFESAAPTSYLIYILPLLSLGIALFLRMLLTHRVQKIAVVLTGVLLCLFGLADAPLSHGFSEHINRDNDEAIDGALAAIETAHPHEHPIVLTFNPAVHRVLLDTNVRLMTTHFVEFPEDSGQSNRSAENIIRKDSVEYILLYRSAIKPDYMREVEPITSAARAMGSVVFEKSGVFTDIGRSYFKLDQNASDTIQLYYIHE
jgi:hypothetical protein